MSGVHVGAILRQVRRLACGQANRALTDADLLRRFAGSGDESAFSELLRRHGSLVWGVCRRVLRFDHAAEDAFQATFLVLARKAVAIHTGHSTASWLYGVAYRVAVRMKQQERKRRAIEERHATMSATSPITEASWGELQAILDEELHRLPEKYRAPFLLCHMEGKSRQVVARELGIKDGTLSSRLAHARKLLQKRLTRRGALPAAVLSATALAARPSLAAVPASILHNTTKAALLFATGKETTIVSASIVSAAKGVMRAMALSRLKIGSFLFLATTLLAVSAGLATVYVQADEKPPAVKAPETATRPPAAKPEAADEKGPRLEESGDPLPDDAIVRLGTTRLRSGGCVTDLRFTPDGKTLMANGGGMELWDVATGKLRFSVPITADNAIHRCADLSADGELLALPCKSGIQIWSTSTGKEVKTVEAGDRINSVHFSPDDKVLATLGGAASNEIALWDVASGKLLRSWTGDKEGLALLAFQPDGKTLISGGRLSMQTPAHRSNVFRFWDVGRGEQVREFDVGPGNLRNIVLSPDGKRLAFSFWSRDEADGNRIEVWDVESGQRACEIKVKPKADLPENFPGVSFRCIHFSSDSKTLYAGGIDNCLIAFDPTTGKERSRHGSKIVVPGFSAIALSHDGKTLAVGQYTHLRLFDMPRCTERFPAEGHSMPINTVLVTPDGRRIVTACTHRILVWDAATGKRLMKLKTDQDYIQAIRFVDEGKNLLVSSIDYAAEIGKKGGQLDKFDLTTGQQTRLENATDSADFVSPRLEGSIPKVRSLDDAFHLLDKTSGKELRKIPKPSSRVWGWGLTPDGARLIAWCADHSIYSWDTATGKEMVKFTFVDHPVPGQPAPAAIVGGALNEGPLYYACLSPDGHSIALSSQNKFLTIHDLDSGKETRKIENLPAVVDHMCYSPNGKSLACGSDRDGEIHVLEVATGRERRRFTAPQGRTRIVTFLPDGKRLLSANDDTTALVWDFAGNLETRKDLARGDLDECWSALADSDASKAFHAIRKLAASPEQAVPYLKEHLIPAAPPDEKRIARLLADLDSDQFDVREGAATELEKLGESAIPAIHKALLDQPSAEVRRRLETLVEKQEGELRNPAPKRLRTLRAVEVLEWIATPEAVSQLRKLGQGSSGSRLTQEAKAALRRVRP